MSCAVLRLAGAPGILGTALAVTRDRDGASHLSVATELKTHPVLLVSDGSVNPNDAVLETLLAVDALRRLGAGPIGVLFSYFPYLRHGCVYRPGEPIAAALIASAIGGAGACELFAIDLTDDTISGVGDGIGNLSMLPTIAGDLRTKERVDWLAVLGLDNVDNASRLASTLDVGLAGTLYERERSDGSRQMETVLSADLDGTVVLYTTEIGSGEALADGVGLLRRAGARRVIVAAVHGLFWTGALEHLRDAGVDRVIVSDSAAGARALQGSVDLVSTEPLLRRAADYMAHAVAD